jgi:hypothetical protein
VFATVIALENVVVLANVTVLENFVLETTLAKKFACVIFLEVGLPPGSATIYSKSFAATVVAAVNAVTLVAVM